MSQSELEAALLTEAPKKWECFQHNKAKMDKSKVKWQREIDEIVAHAGELRQQYDPELMKITANLERKIGSAIGLHCSKCGEPDRGNKMNGKPWCFKCNVPLVSKGQVKLPNMKALRSSFKDDVERLISEEDK